MEYYKEYKEKKKHLKDAIKSAVNYCIKEGILEDYFRQNSSEVASMSFLEYNAKTAMKVARREAMEKGMEQGIEQGEKRIKDYVIELMEQGLSYEEIKKRLEKPSKKKFK